MIHMGGNAMYHCEKDQLLDTRKRFILNNYKLKKSSKNLDDS